MSPGSTGFSPSFTGFFQGKKSCEFGGEIRCYHPLSSPDKLGEEDHCVNRRQDSSKRFKPALPCTGGARESLVPARQPGSREGLAGLMYAVTREALPNGASSRGNACHILLKTLVRAGCLRCPANVRQEAFPARLHSIKPYREADWEPKKPHKSGLLSPPRLAAQYFYRA